ncbi:MAG: hypothetical protein KIT09_07695 [Bryobacteraceae bacterium]|nr:hypothetical protein [Bryobacteraceae bacterium]
MRSYSTNIDLYLALFPWAKFRQRKGAVKMHTLLDPRGRPGDADQVLGEIGEDAPVVSFVGVRQGAAVQPIRGQLQFKSVS